MAPNRSLGRSRSRLSLSHPSTLPAQLVCLRCGVSKDTKAHFTPLNGRVVPTQQCLGCRVGAEESNDGERDQESLEEGTLEQEEELDRQVLEVVLLDKEEGKGDENGYADADRVGGQGELAEHDKQQDRIQDTGATDQAGGTLGGDRDGDLEDEREYEALHWKVVACFLVLVASVVLRAVYLLFDSWLQKA